MDTLSRLDRLRIQPDYLGSLQRRLAASDPSDPEQDPALSDLYLELLFLASSWVPATDEVLEHVNAGGTYSTWPEDWNLAKLVDPLIENWGPEDPRWCMPLAIIEDCLISYMTNDPALLNNEGLWHHIAVLKDRFASRAPEHLTLLAVEFRRLRKMKGPLAAAEASRTALRPYTWQNILEANLTAFSSLSIGELQGLLTEGRLHEADQLSRDHYRMEQAAIRGDAALEHQFSGLFLQTLIYFQRTLGNGEFCIDRAEAQIKDTPPEQFTLEHFWCLSEALAAFLEVARISPEHVDENKLNQVLNELHSILIQESQYYQWCIVHADSMAARTAPATAGFRLARYAASTGDFAKVHALLDTISELPASCAADPHSIAHARLLYRLLESEGRDASLVEDAREFMGPDWAEALEHEQNLQPHDEGSDLLAAGRLGEALDTRLMVEWRGQQGGPLPESALAWILGTQVSGSLARSMELTSPTAEVLRRTLLASGEAVLYFHVGAFHVSAVLIDGSQARLFRLHSTRGFPAAVRSVHSTFLAWHHDPATVPPDWEQAAQVLSGILLPAELREALESLDPSTLYLTGYLDDRYLPWEALPWSDDQTFGERFALAYLPSMVVGVGLAERAQTGLPVSPTLAQLLVTDEPLTGGRLDFDVNQQSLLEAYGNPGDSWDHVVFFGQEASAAALTAPHVPGAALIHVLTHGQEAKEGIPSQTLLMPDGAGGQTEWTYANFDTPLQGSTILLSACAPAAAVPRRGDDGRHHVPGAMLAAGAPTVICSTLPTRFRASQAIDREILAALADGQNPAQALRTMRRNLGEVFGPDRFLPQVIGLSKDRVPARPRSKRANWSRAQLRQAKWQQIAALGTAIGVIGLLWLVFRRT
ncbi:MAG: CHAT domain-containing protein [Planctomycetota bacterium]